jgi:ATP-dependent DNA ligase
LGNLQVTSSLPTSDLGQKYAKVTGVKTEKEAIMVELVKRYGDDPVMVYETWLAKINREERNEYVATVKYDGWRRFLYWTGEITLLSKSRGAGEEARRALPDSLMDQVKALCAVMPEGTAFDAEWMGPRGGFEQELVVHDLLYSAGTWMGHLGYEKRHPLIGMLLKAANVSVIAPNIRVVEAWRGVDLEELFEKQKSDPRSEGLVLKRVGVPLVQDDPFKICNKVLDNWGYTKIKYRDVSASDMARRR